MHRQTAVRERDRRAAGDLVATHPKAGRRVAYDLQMPLLRRIPLWAPAAARAAGDWREQKDVNVELACVRLSAGLGVSLHSDTYACRYETAARKGTEGREDQ